MIIRNYKDNDIKNIYKLWETNISDKWPIDFSFFESIIESNNNGCSHYVAEFNNSIIGFIATGLKDINESKPRGSIVVLLVDRHNQRQGIGSKLLTIAENHLIFQGVQDIQLGAGGITYFWPGVPANLSKAINFFKKCGWTFSDTSVDLTMNISGLNLYDEIPINKDVKIDTPKNKKELLLFEKINFPQWYSYFENYLAQKKLKDILIAEEDGNIVGSLLLSGPYDSDQDVNFKWNKIITGNVGGFGALGVKEEYRGKGIGMALAVRANEVLKSRGVINSYLGWTWLIDWYGKIGYKIWRKYQMSWKIVKEKEKNNIL